MTKRILIIGGTGVFGKRLARHLATFEDIALVVTSRSAEKARQFVKTLTAKHPHLEAQGIALDHSKGFADQIQTLRPFAVVDCSGPFQTSGYETAKAVIAAGAHFVDLADARTYLAGFPAALDTLSHHHGVSALTGASSTPTLSACVVDAVTRGWQRIDTIDICITPGGKSKVGRSVIAAILSYAGQPVPIWENGQTAQTTGWVGAKTVFIPHLGRRRVAPVETFDAELLGPRHAVQSRISFRAGLESPLEQRGIAALARLRKHRLIPALSGLIPLLLQARRITRIPTSDQGGMLVEICGIDGEGRFTQAKWSLVARNDHGPNIPILPAAAAIRALLDKAVPAGAALACDHLCLDDILDQMASFDITTQTAISHIAQSSFATYLGADTYLALPQAVQTFHSQTAPAMWEGRADITGGRSFAAKALSRLFGFPKSGKDIAVTICVDRAIGENGQPIETWTRSFAQKSMSSVLGQQARGRFTERFGPFGFTLGLTADASSLDWPVTGWRIWKMPLPAVLRPQSVAREYEDDQGRFCFDVRLSAPLIGLIAHYQGYLTPRTPEPDRTTVD